MALVKNICVVCSGNICRSPFVEHILKRELGDSHNIYSVGLLGIYDAPAYEVCIDLAPGYLINLKEHRSQGATKENIGKSDYILAMTRQHLFGIQQFSHDGKVHLLSEFLPEGREFDMGAFGKIRKGDEIGDPMGQSPDIVKPVLEVMHTAAMQFAKQLKSST